MAESPLGFLERRPVTVLESAMALLKLRPRDSGYTRPGLVCRFPRLGRAAGYAVTCVYATDEAAMHGRRENFEYWTYVEHVAGAKIAVLVDADPAPGSGSMFGRLNANIHKALGCRAVLTNGGVRDIDDIAALDLAVFSKHLTIGHGNPHVVRFGGTVTIEGAVVSPGDVVVADEHGMIVIPPGALPLLPEAIAETERRVAPVIAYCQSGKAGARGLVDMIDRHMKKAPPWQPKGAPK